MSSKDYQLCEVNKLPSGELFPLSDMWWLTPAALEEQFEQATCGDVIVYGVGQLDYAREFAGGARAIQEITGRLFRQGKVRLTQKKHGPGKYEYWAVKR